MSAVTTHRISGAGREFRLAGELGEVGWSNPVGRADRATSWYDARIATLLGYGVPERYIHPGTGADLTPPEVCRHCWTPAVVEWVCPPGARPHYRYHPLCAVAGAVAAHIASREFCRSKGDQDGVSHWEAWTRRYCEEELLPHLADLGLSPVALAG